MRTFGVGDLVGFLLGAVLFPMQTKARIRWRTRAPYAARHCLSSFKAGRRHFVGPGLHRIFDVLTLRNLEVPELPEEK